MSVLDILLKVINVTVTLPVHHFVSGMVTRKEKKNVQCYCRFRFFRTGTGKKLFPFQNINAKPGMICSFHKLQCFFRLLRHAGYSVTELLVSSVWLR